MKNAIVFIADGTEECEALITVDLLKRAGIHTSLVSVMRRKEVLTSHDIRITADAVAEDADYSSADVLVLPGGIPGVHHIRASETACAQIRTFAAQGKPVAAICAAPTVLASLGLLENRRATVYPGCEKDCTGAEMTGLRCVADGNIITGQAVGSTFDFALTIIRALLGEAASEKVRSQVCY